MRLSELPKGKRARILSYSQPLTDIAGHTSSDDECIHEMLDLGMVPGARVEVRHFGMFGRDPIAVLVRGGLVALRRIDASRIEVEEIDE